jgi:hypothetical protein
MGPQLVRWIAFVRKVLGIPHHLHDIDWVKRANLRAGSHGIGLVAIVLNMVTIAVITAVTKMAVIWRILLSSSRRGA